MNSKFIHCIYYITLILFSEITLLISFASIGLIPRITKIVAHGSTYYLPKYMGIYYLISIPSLWFMRIKFLKNLTYAGLFFLLASAIFSNAIAGNSWLFILLLFTLFILLSVNYYCNYQIKIYKRKSKYLMYAIQKKIKDNDVNGEMADFYSSG